MIIQGEVETITDIDILCKNVLELLSDFEGGKNELNENEEILIEFHGNNILDFEKDNPELDENESNKNSKVDISYENCEEVDYAFIEEFNEDENSYSYGNKKKRKHLIFEKDLTKFYDNLKLTNITNIQFKDN